MIPCAMGYLLPTKGKVEVVHMKSALDFAWGLGTPQE